MVTRAATLEMPLKGWIDSGGREIIDVVWHLALRNQADQDSFVVTIALGLGIDDKVDIR